MRKSIFHSHFRRKYITGEAYITRRQAYITALHSKAISLRVVHIPMRNTLKGGFYTRNASFAKFFHLIRQEPAQRAGSCHLPQRGRLLRPVVAAFPVAFPLWQPEGLTEG